MVGAIKTHAAEVPHLPPAAQAVLVGYVQNGGLYGMPDNGPNGLTAQLAAAMKPTGQAATTQAAAGQASAQPTATQMLAMGAGIELAMKRSFTDSINNTFRIAAIIGVGAAAVSLLMSAASRKKLALADRSETPDVQPMDEADGIAVGE